MDYSQWYQNGKKVSIDIEFNNKIRTLPVNPEDLTIKRSASNTNINIIGLGQATRKGQPGLITMQIKSFFPSPISPLFIYDVTPEDYINFIYEIWETENINNKVAKLVTRGLDKNFSMWFVIDNFDYEYKGGDFDIGYTLSIKEYVPYGAKVINIQNEGMGNDRPVSTSEVVETVNKTYVVSSGDSLWAIAKRSTGDGSNWKLLYDLNKDIVGTNPNYLKIGATLVLPENWNTPVKPTTTAAKKQVTPKVDNSKTTIEQTKENTSQPTEKEIAEPYTHYNEMTSKPLTIVSSGAGDNALTINQNGMSESDLEIAKIKAQQKVTLNQKMAQFNIGVSKNNIDLDNRLLKAAEDRDDTDSVKRYKEDIAIQERKIKANEMFLEKGWKDVGITNEGYISWYKDATGKKHTLNKNWYS